MRTIIFVVPFPAEVSLRFARAYAELQGVRLIGAVQQQPRGAAATAFAGFVKVSDCFNPTLLIEACEKVHRLYGGLHQIVAVLEPLQEAVALARSHFSIPGPDAKTAELFRDKAKMKDALRAAGLPCARHRLLSSLADAVDFVRLVGFPIVLKPPAGAGCKATWRVKSLEELRGVIETIKPSAGEPTLAEEFLTGREYSYDSLTHGGEAVFENISRYYPGPLEVTENPWMQWMVVMPKALSPEFDDARALGRKAIKALGLSTGFTHMEWFRKDDGTLAIGEIAARPPGAQFVEMMGFGHDADFYRAWARAVADDAFDGPYQRKYAVGCAYLRGLGRGRVQRIIGLEKANKTAGEVVVKARLPGQGSAKSDSYEGDGYVIVRHPENDVVLTALKGVIETVRIEYA